MLCELGYFEGKDITVQRGIVTHINISRATSLLKHHPKLEHLSFPVVALYILTGCDYISAFYRCTKTNFLETLVKLSSIICPEDHLLRMINGEFQLINEAAWIKLVTAVYYTKFSKFFRSKDITYAYNLITRHPYSPEAKRMHSAVNFLPSIGKSNLAVWHDFVQRVTYYVPTVTKYHEYKLLPSYQALECVTFQKSKLHYEACLECSLSPFSLGEKWERDINSSPVLLTKTRSAPVQPFIYRMRN